VSNSFLVSTHSKEALLYNDNSVNENGHAATTFRILLQPACNFAKDFEREEFSFFRQLVIGIGEPLPPGWPHCRMSRFILQGTKSARHSVTKAPTLIRTGRERANAADVCAGSTVDAAQRWTLSATAFTGAATMLLDPSSTAAWTQQTSM
jgi:hypothetical protein